MLDRAAPGWAPERTGRSCAAVPTGSTGLPDRSRFGSPIAAAVRGNANAIARTTPSHRRPTAPCGARSGWSFQYRVITVDIRWMNRCPPGSSGHASARCPCGLNGHPYIPPSDLCRPARRRATHHRRPLRRQPPKRPGDQHHSKPGQPDRRPRACFARRFRRMKLV
jgi:hypothetical protein